MKKRIAGIAGATLVSLAGFPSMAALDVRVTIESLAPSSGVFLTPFWVGFHDGTFDLYDRGSPASGALERLAEDGATGPLSASFAGSGAGSVDGTILSGGPIPPFGPGDTGSLTFSLDPLSAASRYFSYASMIIPSNDAFVANGNPLAFPLFDAGGRFVGTDFLVLGGMVLDAGTEVNDEVPSNTAFFGQAAPDTGVAEDGVVELHLGFLPVGSGGILDDPRFAGADFTAAGYEIARITVTQVPEGSTMAGMAALAGLAVLTAAYRGRRRRAVCA